MSGKPRYVILGAGLAGLTTADLLTRAGYEATCLEALPEVGGLARNINFKDHLFDIGGHRFFTDDERVAAYVRDLMGDELLDVVRKSRILLRGKFVDYPLRPMSALAGIGFLKSLHVLAGYAWVQLAAPGDQSNFESWVVRRFGKPLYDVYFGPYTQKVWGVDPTKISAVWAAQRIQLLSLTQAIKKALFDGGGSPRTYVSKFWYPRRGIGRITQRVADRVRRQGGVIKLSQPVEKIEKIETGYRVHAKGEQFEAERVVSTIPVPLLARLLGESVDKSRLAYRSLRCVFLLVNKDRVTDDTWIYTPDRGTIFGRIHEPKNWSPEMVPGKGTSLCLEVFCTEGDELWNLPSDELHRRCVADLERLGFLRADEVGDAHDIKVKNAYPVFLVGYEKDLAQTADRIARHDGVYLVGRTGAYTYINMDQVIADVLRLADRLVDGA